ncbi:signal peptidase I [Flavobacterium piscis]|uniref:Signal peptidase I n=1 Tax=Flavobacterium piscis TaxID=1114874 RepID=A0ABU1Y7A9_9FLAO|nr:signal peptidase I [Flavobacterium piscis]MDR7210120.1 signal peptidase I [Flavobacterium piscis]
MNSKKITPFIIALLAITNLSCQKEVKAFKNSSIANEPTLKLNSTVFISESKVPVQNDFISYNYESEIFGKETRIHRLVAKENDVLEIKNGIVYVNKKDIDQGKNFVHFYKLPKYHYLDIKQKENIIDQFYAVPVGKDSVNALLPDLVAEKYNLKSKRQIKKQGIADIYIKKLYHKDWNEDNFGPLTIPKGKIFIIGDNRHNSEDSRYIGLIDFTQIIGTVVENQ